MSILTLMSSSNMPLMATRVTSHRRLRCAVSDYQTLSNETPLEMLPPAERLWAALERQTANNPHRRRLHSAVKVLRQLATPSRGNISRATAVKAYTVVGLQRVFHWWTPPRQQWVEASACVPTCIQDCCVCLLEVAPRAIPGACSRAIMYCCWGYAVTWMRGADRSRAR